MRFDHSRIRSLAFFGTLSLFMIFSIAGRVSAQPSGYSTTSINVTDFSFTPSSIDSTDAAQTVTVTVRITTAERDFRYMHLTFRSPVIGHMFGFASSDRIAGDARDGIYRKSFTFQQYSHVGTWVVSEIHVTDGTNSYYRWRSLNTAYLTARGFPTELQVINNNEAVPPELTDFSFTPPTLAASRHVTLTVRAKDLASGVTSIDGHFLYPADCYIYDEPCDSFGFEFTAADRISGDDRDGVYRVTVDVPPNVPLGTYYASLNAFDGVRNRTWLTSGEIATRGYPSQLTLAAAPFAGISGRVMTPSGAGLRNATVTLTDVLGATRTAITSSFGYYSFDNVATGSSYTITATSKRYRFASQTLLVNTSLTNQDFVGLE